MPFLLITAGVLIFVTAINNTWKTGPNGGPGLFPQLYSDVFSSNGGFLYWVAALLIVGFIGYIPALKKPADAFIILILVAMILKNGGSFQKFQQALAGQSGSTSPLANGTSILQSNLLAFQNFGGTVGNSAPLTTPAPGSGSGGIGSA